MKNEQFEIDFLTDKDNYYLSIDKRISYKKCTEIDLSDIALYKIEEVSFEDQSPRREALENVLSTMKIEGINFIYLILGSNEGVEFYYGVSRNYNSSIDPGLNIMEIGSKVLEPSIKGNFRGSKTKEVKPKDKRDIIVRIEQMSQFSMLEGVPGVTKEDEKYQGVDRLADVMMGDTFGYLIVATPASYDEIKDIEKDLYDIYSRIVPFSKKSMQSGNSTNESRSDSTSTGTSSNKTVNYSKTQTESITITNGTSDSEQSGTNKSKGSSKTTTNGDGSGDSKSYGTNESGGTSNSTTKGKSHSEAKNDGGSQTEGTSTSEGKNEGESTQVSKGKSSSSSTTFEYIDKKSQDWIKYLDEVIIPRLDYGMGKGIFITTSFVFSDSKATIKKLENTVISLYSGEKGNKVPLRAVEIKKEDPRIPFVKNFQIPVGQLKNKTIGTHEAISRSALSQYISDNGYFAIGNWITTNELALISGLPLKEVVGLALKEEVEFGLNYKSQIDDENRMYLGDLIQSGNILQTNKVFLDKKDLDKHIFIAGVTGSGKTTTCHNILCNSNLPFLVIEPAKTEYRVLKEIYPDLLVFTLGNENVGTPFRLNPFEFFQHESITSRVDMIRASIEAAFDMEAAIPQIIESAIYACYEDYGWDISTKKNSKFPNPYDDGVYAFPTLEDLINKIPVVVDEQGFDARLKNDYIGSIKARLMGLMMGTKGMMLNTPRSIDFKDLLNRRVVLELEEIRNGDEKSLIMGFVLMNLIQAIRGKYINGITHKHVTLVEEAHRLLSKFVAGDSPNKKRGVETFTDMLAEIRKYGECLVIVDQIPNKMTPEILKNTNTKIVHKIFAEDDKDAIGNTIILDKEQKEFLSNLDTGRAIVFSQGYSKAIQVKVKQVNEIDDEKHINEEELRPAVYEYYATNYKKGLITNSQYLDEKPDPEMIKQLLDLSYNKKLSRLITQYCKINVKFPKANELGKMREIINDGLTETLLEEITKKENQSDNLLKEKCVQYIVKYKAQFGIDWLGKILVDSYYESKNAKRNNSLQKKIFYNMKQLIEYLEKYISEQGVTETDKRNIRDLL